MVTTVTDNSPQSINTSLFAMDGEIQKVKKIAESFDEKLSGIDIETGVLSVNGKRGVVELDASDVDALPSSTVIPTTTSELENTSGFITINDVGASFVPITRKVNNKALNSDITLTASDVGALPNTTVIPTKTSQLTNDNGFITSSGSITGNAATATKAGTADKVKNALTVNGKTYDGSSAVNAGVQTVENGGTGVTTQADINKAFIGNLELGDSDVTDGTEFVSSWATDNGFAETADGGNKPYKRQFIKVWNYIKGKISSVLGLTKDNYGGKASTAGNADTVDNYHASQLWRSDGANWNPSANVTMTPSGNDSEWSFDFRNKNGATGLYWQVWDENKQTLLKVNADDGKVSAPYGFVGNLSGKASTAGTADVANALAGRSGITNTDTFQNVMNNDGKWNITDLNQGWSGSFYSLHAGGSQSGLMFRIRGGSTDIRNIEVNYSIDSNRFAGPWTPLIGRIPIGAPSSPKDGDIWIS